jgi:diguanylate cyclase (GGDEF)-like protein/PAS domain S-box-containing protein
LRGFAFSSRWTLPQGGVAGQHATAAGGFDGLLDGLLDLLPDKVFQTGSDGIIRAAQLVPSADSVLEARAAALVGAHVSDLLAPDVARLVMAALGESLETGQIISRDWEYGTAAEGNRSYRHGTFIRSGPDSVLVVTRDVTMERCRSDTDRFVIGLGRRLIAQPMPGLKDAMADALQCTASFVGGRGALLLVPDDDAEQDFTIASSWGPNEIRADIPVLKPGKTSWLARFMQGLEEPVVIEADALPTEAQVVRWIVSEYGFAAIGLIPIVCDFGRVGVVAIGFPSCPDLVSRHRLSAMGPLGHLLSGVEERRRREADRVVRDAEDRFRATAHESADITLVLSEEGRLLFVSSSVQDLLGFAPEEVIGHSGFDFVHPDDHAEVTETFEELGSARPTVPGRVFRIRHRDGSWHRFEWLITDRRDDPTVGGFVAVAREVTGKLAAEDAQRESEQRFRELAERASDMIYRFALRPEPHLEYVSPAAEAITGYTPEELYADPGLMLQSIHPDDRERALAPMVNPGTAIRQLRLRGQHPDGTWGWTEHRIVPVLDEAGLCVTVEGVARDITEQVRAETELLESDQLSRSVIESIPGPTAVLDASGTIIRANEAWDTYMPTAGTSDASRLRVGANYVAFCEHAAAQNVEGAAELVAGVRAVLTGAQALFRLDYPASGPADDRWFLVKVSPLRSGEGGVVVLYTDITERKRYEHELARQALHDPLTGLPNRALLADRLEGAIGRAKRNALSVGVLLADLDRFKAVNDGLGHAAGDSLLVAIAARLTQLIRPGDTVARLGGDEFVVLCEGLTSRNEVAEIAGRIVAGFAEPFGPDAEEQARVTASIGIALADRGTDAEALLRDADAAMYHAKQLGRNRYEFYDQQLRAETIGRLLVETDLRSALECDQLRLFYQPVVDLNTGAITGVEALLRWQHPSRGLLGPAEFLAVAEETGLIVPIGAWVLQEACRQQREWLTAYPELQRFEMAVNASAQQLRRPGFVDEVLAVVAEAGIPPEGLSLELTETALMDEAAGPNATRLREAGLHLAVDDFGIAYSSLSYLKRFPVSTVKIDKSFIDGLPENPEDAAIVQAVVGMAHALGFTTIAEGVERADQRDRLLSLGCRQAQGHLYAPASPAPVIAALLQRGTIHPKGTWSAHSTWKRRRRPAPQPSR